MQREQIQASKAIQKRTGRTFYLATRFLPRRVRTATHALYAFFRIADEVVDDPGDASPAVQIDRLEELRAQALDEAPPEGPVLEAFQAVKTRYDVPDAEIDAFVDAMQRDVSTDRYETAAALETYMRGSAAAVGVMMTAIMEPDDPEAAVPHAISLGEAFQLTNFLRDVREDVRDRGRIYVPLETLERHGVDPADIERLEPSEGFTTAIAEELQRTERLYRDGVAGIRYLPDDCQFPVLLAAVLYAEHHRAIREQGYDVLTDAPTLSRRRKLSCVARTWWQWQFGHDPETVFERVSAVPSGEREPIAAERGDGLATR